MAKIAPSPVERVRGEHPSDESWRADALSGSRHTRWIDELREPLEDHSPDRAVELCAQVTRAALRDFAPAFILSNARERQRAQALAAHVLVLFDFANQSGLEGERLTHLNRVEFDLESALDGTPRGQPVFVAMAMADQESPWSRDALDRLGACARRRVATPRPTTDQEAEVEATELAASLSLALFGDELPARVALGAAVLRLHALVELREAVRRGRAQLSVEALPDNWMTDAGKGEQLARAVSAECTRLGELLDQGSAGRAQTSATLGRSLRYLELAARRLLARAEELGCDLLDGRPTLGAATRVALLLRARSGL